MNGEVDRARLDTRSCEINYDVVGRVGFEPTKAQGQQIYSLSQLTALVPTHKYYRLYSKLLTNIDRSGADAQT